MSSSDQNNHDLRGPWVLTILGLLVISVVAVIPTLLPAMPANPSLMRFVGRFHPVVLHLPIGIMALVLLQEITSIFNKRSCHANSLTLGFAATSAVAAAITGILLIAADPQEFQGQELVRDHLRGGIAFAISAILLMLVHSWTEARRWRRHFFRLTLLASVACMTAASHDGASITHGSNYLSQYAPEWIKPGSKPTERPPNSVEPGRETTGIPPQTASIYQTLIQPIFNQRCVQCHKEGKAKGKLRMDGYEGLIQGGVAGPAIMAGNAAASLIVERMTLPEDDELHMPPPGKPDVTPAQLALIRWWIDEGASPTLTTKDIQPPSE